MVKFLTYKEKKLPIRVSYFALKMMKDKITGPEITDASNLDNFGFEQQEQLLYYGLVSGHKATGEVMPFKQEDMEDILDECYFDFLKMLPDFFKGLNPNGTAPIPEKQKK